MVIPIDKIGEVVAETFRQIKTGVLAVRTEGVAIVELPDSKYGAQGVQFSMTVLMKDGLNAVERKQTQIQDESTVTEQVEEGYVSTRKEESTKAGGVASSTQNTQQSGGSGASGSNTVTTTYEYE
tara:strand:+ start:1214 stop:1588 length:375 start_codon:yes stop_codon:yes gene_type:complete